MCGRRVASGFRFLLHLIIDHEHDLRRRRRRSQIGEKNCQDCVSGAVPFHFGHSSSSLG